MKKIIFRKKEYTVTSIQADGRDSELIQSIYIQAASKESWGMELIEFYCSYFTELERYPDLKVRNINFTDHDFKNLMSFYKGE